MPSSNRDASPSILICLLYYVPHRTGLTLYVRQLAEELSARGLTVLYDDREKVSPGVKFKDAELIGVPTIVTVGRGLADGTIEVKDRRSGERTEVPFLQATNHLVHLAHG